MARPPLPAVDKADENWQFSTGFINEDMVRDHLFPGEGPATLVRLPGSFHQGEGEGGGRAPYCGTNWRPWDLLPLKGMRAWPGTRRAMRQEHQGTAARYRCRRDAPCLRLESTHSHPEVRHTHPHPPPLLPPCSWRGHHLLPVRASTHDQVCLPAGECDRSSQPRAVSLHACTAVRPGWPAGVHAWRAGSALGIASIRACCARYGRFCPVRPQRAALSLFLPRCLLQNLEKLGYKPGQCIQF